MCKEDRHDDDHERSRVPRQGPDRDRGAAEATAQTGRSGHQDHGDTICGTDVHIIKGEYPVRPGLIGHEPVGNIDQLGEELEDEYSIGQRVIVGAITPCGSASIA